jgi:hypothetical protein
MGKGRRHALGAEGSEIVTMMDVKVIMQEELERQNRGMNDIIKGVK